jgi:hypothetical protein
MKTDNNLVLISYDALMLSNLCYLTLVDDINRWNPVEGWYSISRRSLYLPILKFGHWNRVHKNWMLMLIGTSSRVIEYVNYEGLCKCKFENTKTELHSAEWRQLKSEDLGPMNGWRIILKLLLKKLGKRTWIWFSGLGWGPVERFCDSGDESSGSMKGEGFVAWLGDRWLLK